MLVLLRVDPVGSGDRRESVRHEVLVNQALINHCTIPVNPSWVDSEYSGTLDFELGVMCHHYPVDQQVTQEWDNVGGGPEIPIPTLLANSD
jgi:hypothetical protein